MTTSRSIRKLSMFHSARIALATSLLAAVVALPATAQAAAPAWSVSDVVSSPTTTPTTGYLTQGDGLQGGYDLGAVNSWPNVDTVAVTVANSGTAASSGLVTATLTYASGITPADILNSWITGTGSTTSGSNQVTGVTVSNAGYTFAVGNVVTGTGIPSSPPTTITAVSGASPNLTLTLSANATATSSSPVALTLAPGVGTATSGQTSVSAVSGGPYGVGNSYSGGVTLTATVPSGDVQSGSTTITSPTQTSGVFNVGTPISGTDIASGAFITACSPSCGSPTSWTMSLPASGTTTSTDTITGTDVITAVSGTTTPGFSASFGAAPGTGTLTLLDPATSSTTTAIAEAATRVTATGSGWICSNGSPEVCTTSATAAAGASLPPISEPVQVTATAGAASQQASGGSAGAHVNFEPSVTGGGAPAVTLPWIPIAIEGIANLTTVDVPNGAFRQGDTNDSYSLYVTNTGVGPTRTSTPNPNTGTANNPIVVTETIPTGETASALYGGGWNCSLAATTAGVGGAPYTLPADSCWTLQNLPWGSDLPTITLAVNVASNAGTPQSLSTKVSGGDTEAGSTSVSASTTIQQSADLITDSVHIGSFNQGDANDQYYVYTRNIIGPNSTVGGPSYGPVTVVDQPPLGMTITSMSGPGWTCTLTPATLVQPPTTPLPNVLEPADSCTRFDPLAVNTNYPNITVNVSLLPNTVSGGNTVTISGGDMTTASMAGGGQTFTDATTVNLEPDLTVDGFQSQNGAIAPSVAWTQGDASGAGDAFLLSVANYGYAATSGTITVTDTVPNGISLVGTSPPASGSGWTCGVDSTGQIVTCTTPASVDAGGVLPTITVPVKVSASAGTSPINNVTVSGGGEINTSNDYANQSAIVNQLPDLTPEVTDSGSFTQGSTGTFYVDVTNLNQVGTTGAITLSDSVSSGLTITGVTQAPGTSGWTCMTLTSTTASCTTSNVLNPVATAAFDVSVSVAAGASSSQSDTATVSGGGEIITTNDTATDTIGVLTAHAIPAPGFSSSSTGGPDSGGTQQPATSDSPSSSGSASSPGSSSATVGAASTGSTSTTTSTGATSTTGTAHTAVLRGLTKLLSRSGTRYTVSGKLLLPAGVSRASACTGSVAVLIQHGSRLLVRTTARVTPSCTYSASGKLAAKVAGQSTTLQITARFSGNAVLLA